MEIYLDTDYCCHLTDGGGMRQIETDVFNGKCAEYIEGYRFVPFGESWTRPDGVVFKGQAILLIENNYRLLQRFQTQHEADMAASADMAEALAILGVTE